MRKNSNNEIKSDSLSLTQGDFAMFILKPACLACVLLLLGGNMAFAQVRQYFSEDWQQRNGYFFKNYYYKVTPDSNEYHHHVVVYHPDRPGYYYYYNPSTGKYWGRWDCKAQGYSRLAPADQRGLIGDINEKSFPAPGKMPTIPGADDGTGMLPPPEALRPISLEGMPEMPAIPGMPGMPGRFPNCPNGR
jgi:hypothetical protein